MGELELAKESLKAAIKLAPSDKTLRGEYDNFISHKHKKEREWFSKMEGFYGKEHFKRIEDEDEREQQLKEIVWRKFQREEEREEEFEKSERESKKKELLGEGAIVDSDTKL